MNGIHVKRFRSIPPLQYLLGFEAAARLGSFAAAAEELGLTHSAVSHQMRLLEDRLGQPLFLRIGRNVRLSDAGRDYQRSVAQSLDLLDKGHRRLAPYADPDSVVIYAPRDFTARWLMPRLATLLEDCPGVEPWIDTSGRIVDFNETEASIAIGLADGPPPAGPALVLGHEQLTPLHAPGAEWPPVAGQTLIHCETAAGWPEWFESSGAPMPDAKLLTFTDQDLVLDAAAAGLGAALSCRFLGADDVQAGRLVAPATEILPSGRQWIAVTTGAELANAATLRVWRWLERQADIS